MQNSLKEEDEIENTEQVFTINVLTIFKTSFHVMTRN